ncbi:hypothetical protein Acor_74880 [Acrocarpospora corrugata]|uniref:IrrE N-terminal-like domain-containing protein n=1 Tax=Acrocarpospora corrugata TaxID=35763 RepID=A0A5M3WB05_9ACTN|nr:ImmA/IrrE family metallo-endopeptidase [Acrocarpospora corrugata]GES05420.1 hypothetical protein Acor_74880 [Acrocarpospora corrugata]
MTIHWEKFDGNTDLFAIRISFIDDPHRGAAATPEETMSWGALQLWVGGENLCAHVDQGEVLQHSHWYLLSVLEWIADNWNAILHEEKLPNRNGETAAKALAGTRNAPALAGEPETLIWEQNWYDWHSRHALRSARDGGLLPNVVIRRLNDLIELSWNDEPLAGTVGGFRYSATSGAALLTPRQVADPLFKVTREAAEYLCERMPHSSRIAALANRLKRLEMPDQEHERLAWLAGIRMASSASYPLESEAEHLILSARWAEIMKSLRQLGADATGPAFSSQSTKLTVVDPSHAALLFSSVSPTVTQKDIETLGRVLIDQQTTQDTVPNLDRLCKDATPDLSSPAWEQGYDLAEEVLDQIPPKFIEQYVDIEALLSHLGVAVISLGLEDHNIRACAIVGKEIRATVVQNTNSPFYDSLNAKRFSMAHELCHLLFDRSRGRKLAIASGPWAPEVVERRANAFAAMFLMPIDLVQQAIADLPDPITDYHSISEVAERLHVSRRAAIEHLYNLTLMTDLDREALLRQLRDT